MQVPVKSASPHTISASVGGRPCVPRALRQPGWQHATAMRRRFRGLAAQTSAEQASQTGSTNADGAIAEESRQPASSASGSSVSSTLDSLDALISFGSTDAEDEQQPGVTPTAPTQTLFCILRCRSCAHEGH